LAANVSGHPYNSQIPGYLSRPRVVSGLDLSILADADADQPSCAKDPEPTRSESEPAN